MREIDKPPDKPTEQLTGLELRAAVAVEVMQWTDIRIGLSECSGRPPCESGSIFVFHWESDRTAAGLVIDKIGELGLKEKFIRVLAKMTDNAPESVPPIWVAVWKILNATPEQISRAALAVCRERSGTP